MSKDSSDQPDESKWPKSVTDPIPRGELPKKLQKIADEQDDWMDEIYDGAGPDTTETQLRYAAYARRLKTVMLSAQRYVAYTSDIGESFRPVAHPYWIRTAYGISWAYLIGDVAHEGYKAFRRNEQLASPGANQHFDATAKDMPATKALPSAGPMHIPAIEDYRSVMAQRALFQSVASMGLPAFTIHSVVKYSGRAFRNAANTTVRTWAPIGLGLAVVPALPFLFDKPVEEAVEWSFYQAFRAIGGENAVGQRHAVGRSEELQKEAKVTSKVKEKEL